MTTPASISVAAITLMLWILWRDSLRPQRRAPILYALRTALYIIASGILVLNRVRYPSQFTRGETILVIVAASIGVFGAAYFMRRLTIRA
jgi:hypothetical protein